MTIGNGNPAPVTTQPGAVPSTHTERACGICCLPVSRVVNSSTLPGSCCKPEGCCGFVGWGCVLGSAWACGPVGMGIAACRSGMCCNQELEVKDSGPGSTPESMPLTQSSSQPQSDTTNSSGGGNSGQSGGQS